jgi:hypothetical protein
MLDAEKMMENKHWAESQPKPQHRQKKQVAISGVQVIKDARVVTKIKVKF